MVSKLWGRIGILNRLIRVGHMYSFPSFYLILSKIVLFITSLIDMSFFTTSTTVCMCVKLSNILNEHAEHISRTLLKRELNSLSDICVGCFPSGTRKQEGKIWSYTLKRKDVSFIYMNQTSKPAYIFVDQLQASSFWELDGLYSPNSDWVCEQHWSQVDVQWQKMFGIHK